MQKRLLLACCCAFTARARALAIEDDDSAPRARCPLCAPLKMAPCASPSFCAPPQLPAAPRELRRAPRCSLSAARATKTILSWDVGGLRALARTQPRALSDLLRTYDPHVVCLQQTRLQRRHEPLFFDALPRFDNYVFHSSTSRLSYSGTVTYSRVPIRVCQRKINHVVGDEEGRMVMIEYPCLFVINVHNMHSGRALQRLSTRLSWEQALRKHIRNVRHMGKPLLLLGNLNVARHPLDVHQQSSAEHNRAGCSDLERLSFEHTLETCGLVDMFRVFHPHQRAFTYWNGSASRLDYALVSDDMLPAVKSVTILHHVRATAHCPLLIELTDGIL
eukprot:TRINITY_DN439_c1_g1_i1.p1 TRINITY_DN439_c1_g1~~TRINITY_DN439_c1_g1_i1.p1  ORF type:complete len:333 (-),score=75.89 TRINITY_DN439_c1_g1_i1:58-1056(-)